MSTLKERLLLAMSDLPGATQAALAAACGIKSPSVNDWFSGKTKSIKGTNLLRAAVYLQVRPEWLASGRGPMRLDQQESRFLRPITRIVPREARPMQCQEIFANVIALTG